MWRKALHGIFGGMCDLLHNSNSRHACVIFCATFGIFSPCTQS